MSTTTPRLKDTVLGAMLDRRIGSGHYRLEESQNGDGFGWIAWMHISAGLPRRIYLKLRSEDGEHVAEPFEVRYFLPRILLQPYNNLQRVEMSSYAVKQNGWVTLSSEDLLFALRAIAKMYRLLI